MIQKDIQHRDHGFTFGAGYGWLDEATHASLSAELKAMLQEVNDLSKVFGGDNKFVLGRRIEVAKRLLILGQVDDAERVILEILDNIESSTPQEDRLIPTYSMFLADRQKMDKAFGKLEICQPQNTNDSPEFKKLLELANTIPYNNCIYWLAVVFSAQGRWKDAEVLLVHVRNRTLLNSSELRGSAWDITARIGILYRDTGKFSEAAAIFDFLSRLMKFSLGAEHAQTLEMQSQLADMYIELGKFALAESLLQEIYPISTHAHGRAQWITRHIRRNLMKVYNSQARFEEAARLGKQVLSIYSSAIGLHGRQQDSRTLGDVGAVLANGGSLDEGEELLRKALQLNWGLERDSMPGTLSSRRSLAAILGKKGNLAESERHLLEILGEQEARLYPQHDEILTTKLYLSGLYEQQKRSKDAEKLFLPVIEGQLKLYGDRALVSGEWTYALVDVYIRQRRFRDAEKLQVRVVDVLRKQLPDENPKRLRNESKLARIYYDQRRYNDSGSILAGKLHMFKAAFGVTRETSIAFGLLAQSFYGQRLWKEADTAFQELLEMINNHDHLYRYRRWATTYRVAILVKSGRWWPAVRYIRDNFSLLEDQFWTETSDFFGLEDYLLRICTGRYLLLALSVVVPLITGLLICWSHFDLFSGDAAVDQ